MHPRCPLFLVAAGLALVAQTMPEVTSTSKDRTALGITIYNDNLALVKDQREVRLGKGRQTLAFQEVSAQIRPETALLRNLTLPKDFWVVEQNFDFDLLTPTKLLEKYVGQKVTVLRSLPNAEGAGTREVREEALVLATNSGVVLQFPDRIETSVPGRIVYPRVPETLRARPTLVIDLHSGVERAQKLELSYLTGGLSWRADYVANLAPDGKTLDLSGWVTLTNQSGAAYPNATLQLVAGDVNRVRTPLPKPLVGGTGFSIAGSGMPFVSENLFEYHIYTLDRPTTLKENQTKQLALLSASGVPVRKEYVLKGHQSHYAGPQSERRDQEQVGIFVEFDNRLETRMGMPLPKGIVRVYKRDSEGRAQFVGEDSIDHTPKNEWVRLKLGNAFDVTARRKQTDFKRLGHQSDWRRVLEVAFEVELKNAKQHPVSVSVLEPIGERWEVVQKSHTFTKEAGGNIKFKVEVPAEGTAMLSFRVRPKL